MSTKMKLQVAHQVPGRIRMKVPSGKDNAELLEQIKQTFSVIPGIEQVTVNPTTGSVVLHYDTEKHDEFHGHLHHHTGGHFKPPSNEIDSLASKIEEEAEYLAEHLHEVPIHVIPGNHDRREVLLRELPGVPSYEGFVCYAVDDLPVRLVMLDTVVPGAGHGTLCDERLAWLDRTLAAAPEKPTMGAGESARSLPPATGVVAALTAVAARPPA